MAMTFEERCDQAARIANDKLLESKDVLNFLYHWGMMEYNNFKAEKYLRRRDKHSNLAQKKIQLFNFQHDLEKL